MKHVFIVNPAAGRRDQTELIRQKLADFPEYDWEVYVTRQVSDATRYVRDWCSLHSEPVRFYACGGDGTLNEVVNGAYGFPQAAVSCYPCGSGNDFVKYYGGTGRFLDIKQLLDAPEQSIDLLRVGGRFSVNMVNFGFDTTVARTMEKMRRSRLFGGKRAYYVGILRALLVAMKTGCLVQADGELLNDGQILLCSAANGSHVGGSFCPAPRARNDDGWMEVCLVRPLRRISFLRLVKHYANGTHLTSEQCRPYLVYRRAKHLKVSNGRDFAIILDGEIVAGNDFDIDIVPRAIRFAVPGSPAVGETSVPAAVQAGR
ncbi:MAG: diacylglycerol kinase family protein [Eubacteriales bacterium]